MAYTHLDSKGTSKIPDLRQNRIGNKMIRNLVWNGGCQFDLNLGDCRALRDAKRSPSAFASGMFQRNILRSECNGTSMRAGY